jgi:hypothetical protein
MLVNVIGSGRTNFAFPLTTRMSTQSFERMCLMSVVSEGGSMLMLLGRDVLSVECHYRAAQD